MVNESNKKFRELLRDLIIRIEYAKTLGKDAGVKREMSSLYENVLGKINLLLKMLETTNFAVNYVSKLIRDVESIITAFPSGPGPNYKFVPLQEIEKPIFKHQLEREENQIIRALESFIFTLDFFTKLDFLNRNIVAVGANGSGKTILAENLKTHIQNNGVVISAQRILFIPFLGGVRSTTSTQVDLKTAQTVDKTNKDITLSGHIQEEFGIVLQNAFAEHAKASNELLAKVRKGVMNVPPLTNLEKTLAIWNSVFKHREISCLDGMNITVKQLNDTPYHASRMSDGEKVILYFIAQILQSPIDGFVIVDEPEMHLHPTIHKKLWDLLERERPDNIFIYFTHDLDFATSRSSAKKLWIRSFTYPDKYEIEEIPTNEIPQPLLMELLGGRKDILFCEGKAGGLDERVYFILFPNYVVKPVGSCLEVIAYTKAYNKIQNITSKAVGVIDADFHSRVRLKALEPERVFGIRVAEVENLLLDKAILKSVCRLVKCDAKKISEIQKAILKKLADDRNYQVANSVLARIELYFKGSNMRKGGDVSDLVTNFDEFVSKVKIAEWYEARKAEVVRVVRTKNYERAIAMLNNKGGILAIPNHFFRISDFAEKAIALLEREERLRTTLLRHFPKEIGVLPDSHQRSMRKVHKNLALPN